jgi:hypothetical protein
MSGDALVCLVDALDADDCQASDTVFDALYDGRLYLQAALIEHLLEERQRLIAALADKK